MKFFPEYDGSEYYYSMLINVQFEEGGCQCDYNNIAPCAWIASSDLVHIHAPDVSPL